MNTKVIAIIGCGRIARNAHFPALNQLENVRIKYACDLLPEKAEALREILTGLLAWREEWRHANCP